MVNADVQYKEQRTKLPLLVVQCEGPSLLGRSWLQCLQLDWKDIRSMQDNSLQAVLARHAAVFKEELGSYKDSGLKF